jgi:hypothetical protein
MWHRAFDHLVRSQRWWQIHYNVSGGTPNDVTTFKFALIGSPLHLLA